MVEYEIIIYWSREDEAFIAEVPELPGCATDGGTTRKPWKGTRDHTGVDRDGYRLGRGDSAVSSSKRVTAYPKFPCMVTTIED